VGWVEAQQKEVVCLFFLYPSPLFKHNSNLNLRSNFKHKLGKIQMKFNKLQGSHTNNLYFLNFIILLKLNLGVQGRIKESNLII
jgi:hypothetical protein